MRRSDSLRTITTGFLLVRRPLPRGGVCLRLSAQARRRPGAGGMGDGYPMPSCPWSRRASQVPGEPLYADAVFLDPGGTRATRPQYGGQARPPAWQHRRLPAG